MDQQEYDYDECGYDDGGGYTYEGTVPHGTAGSSDIAAHIIGGDLDREAHTISVNEALEMQAAVVSAVMHLTCLSANAATLLLADNLWSQEVAVERYFADPDGVLQKLSLNVDTASHENTLCSGPSDTQVQMCEICAMDYAGSEVRCLSSCGHYFCMECWQDHVKSHVHRNLLATRCPAQHCSEVVGIRNMSQLLDDGSDKAAAVMKDVYREYLTSFVESCPALYWCPNPVGCTGIIHVEVPPLQGQGITCDVCHQEFCLRCAAVPHRPATCDNLRSWRNYCSAEGLSMNFILAHTKRCPSCHKNIEKNMGCNHMTCRCGHQFCWVCLGDWNAHNGNYYSCKNAMGAAVTAADRSVTDSRRFMFHFERYHQHLDSAKRDAQLIDNLTSVTCISELEKRKRQQSSSAGTDPCPPANPMSAPDFLTLKNTLVTARQVIAHAYVQMFYLDDNSREAVLLAHRVGMLEGETEKLSHNLTPYLPLSIATQGSMSDLIQLVNRWQKVVCEV